MGNKKDQRCWYLRWQLSYLHRGILMLLNFWRVPCLFWKTQFSLKGPPKSAGIVLSCEMVSCLFYLLPGILGNPFVVSRWYWEHWGLLLEFLASLIKFKDGLKWKLEDNFFKEIFQSRQAIIASAVWKRRMEKRSKRGHVFWVKVPWRSQAHIGTGALEKEESPKH